MRIPCGRLGAVREGEVAWSCFRCGLRARVTGAHLRSCMTRPLAARCTGERCKVQFNPSEAFLGTPLRPLLGFPRLPQAPAPGVSDTLPSGVPTLLSPPLKRTESQLQAPSRVLQTSVISGFSQMPGGLPPQDLAGRK